LSQRLQKMLKQVTPLILTYNEAPNIGRSLERLSWARDIVVVDSFSDDDTLEIVSRFPQVRIFQREFDCLENQWNYALNETGVRTQWILALDADYIATPELIDEIRGLYPPDAVNGYRARFAYCIYGKQLRGSAYQPVVVLYRREHARYRQDGHAHRVVVNGRVDELRSLMLHDDRKSVARWLNSQSVYQRQEMTKLLAAESKHLTLPDRIRKQKLLSPLLVFLYCLLIKGGIFDGKAGFYYAFQRMIAEALLSVYLLDEELSRHETQELELPKHSVAFDKT
jgi:glycosyltransferase involved in cell wall biosynthesis